MKYHQITPATGEPIYPQAVVLMDPDSGNSIRRGPKIATRGVKIDTGGSSAYVAIPNTSTGAAPSAIRLAATAACYARLGPTSEASLAIAAAGDGYVSGETITVSGGTFSAAMTATVATAKLISTSLATAGTGYKVNDIITAAGGTAATKATFTVTHTEAVSATVVAGGTGGTPGAVTLTGTTGTGTKFQATGTIGGDGILAGALVVTVAGDYTADLNNAAVEPVTATASLIGCMVSVGLGVKTFAISEAGIYSVTSGNLWQTSVAPTGGSGVTFDTASWGVLTATVVNPGAYTVDPSNPVSTTSNLAGTGATFTATMITGAAAGDILITPYESITLDAVGFDHVAAIQVSGAGVLQISPLEN